MRGVVVNSDDRRPGAQALEVAQVPDPEVGPGDVLIEVAAAGVNRADILQRQGLYPPPPGASELMGLECSGTVVEVGAEVRRWHLGDRVCALLSGGGYAQYVSVAQGQVMPVPDEVDLIAAAGLPEAACTVMSNLSMTARLAPCEWVLLHGGASGIGTFAIQWAKALGARVVATVGSDDRRQICLDLGADEVVNYREKDFVEQVSAATDGHGADVILDIVGAKYLDRNVQCLARGGRLVVIGLQGGVKGELNLGRLLSKQGVLAATSLRSLTADEKSAVCVNVVENMWPLFEDGHLRPVIDQVMPLENASQAHERIEDGGVTGKLILSLSADS